VVKITIYDTSLVEIFPLVCRNMRLYSGHW